MSFPVFEALFGSRVRARLIRLFILNPSSVYTSAEIAEKTLLSRPDISRDIRKLVKMKMLKESSRKREKVFQLRPDFPFFSELKSLVVKSNVDVPKQMFNKFKAVGDVKLLLTGGLFLDDPKSKTDLVLVVNNSNRNRLSQAMEKLEAEIGQEVRFVLMDTDELNYRLNMLDRFLIEFLEGPYQEVVNRLPGWKRVIAGIRR
jgi:DNA-binding transcriptional regulator GbsR (MarR family)